MDDGPARDAESDNSNRELLQTEIDRLNKIVQVLMDRAERSLTLGNSDFAFLQTSVMLEDEVRRRTDELTAALQENEKITRALRESEGLFRALADQSMVGIGILEDGHVSYANSKAAEVFGYPREAMLLMTLNDLVLPPDRQRVGDHMQGVLVGEVKPHRMEFRGLRRDGSIVQAEVSSSPMEVGGKPALVFLISDITARKHAEDEVRVLQARLHQQVIHDPLTAMYNRRYLDETFDRELVRAERRSYPVAVVLGDIDLFKDANDKYGHLAGDEILRTLGGLMRRSCRSSDIGYRYGGEEFLLVFPDMAVADARVRTEELRCKVEDVEIPFGTLRLSVTMSFGVAVFPDDGKTPDELIAAADHALYRAKDLGRNRVELAERS